MIFQCYCKNCTLHCQQFNSYDAKLRVIFVFVWHNQIAKATKVVDRVRFYVLNQLCCEYSIPKEMQIVLSVCKYVLVWMPTIHRSMFFFSSSIHIDSQRRRLITVFATMFIPVSFCKCKCLLYENQSTQSQHLTSSQTISNDSWTPKITLVTLNL